MVTLLLNIFCLFIKDYPFKMKYDLSSHKNTFFAMERLCCFLTFRFSYLMTTLTYVLMTTFVFVYLKFSVKKNLVKKFEVFLFHKKIISFLI